MANHKEYMKEYNKKRPSGNYSKSAESKETRMEKKFNIICMIRLDKSNETRNT